MKLRLFALVMMTESMQAGSPWAIVWSAPSIILASIMIAWGAEAAQFFLAQGIALAVLALLQTLPEFAVEAVLAWEQQTPYLLANLTGALKLLTGLGWPMIYFAAAGSYRKEHKKPLGRILLAPEQAIQVMGVIAAVAWQFVIWYKSSLTVYDAIPLLAVYAAYIAVMAKLPPQDAESLDDIDAVPRAIVKAKPAIRNAAILGLFVVGGVTVFAVAHPFVSSLFGLSTAMGVPTAIFISWVAPMVSEAPEGVSAYFWARDYPRASIALMNLVSSNINQWTLLAAMLPIVLSFSTGHFTPIPLDSLQERELLMTIAQSLLGALFLLNMELTWWEAGGLFGLWLVQFVLSIGDNGARIHEYITWIYFAWGGVEIARLVFGKCKPLAWTQFREAIGKRR